MRTELLPPVFGLVVINVAVALPPREQVPLHYELDRPHRTELHKRVEHNISIDNSCGFFGAGQGNSYQCNPNAGNGGLCCGPMGFCGNTETFCGLGCQPEYGWCGSPFVKATADENTPSDNIPSRPIPESTPIKARTEPKTTSPPISIMKGSCSGGGCCPLRGVCPLWAGGAPPAKLDIAPVIFNHMPLQMQAGQGRCGSANRNKSCPPWQCCSMAGYCGTSRDHCRTPECQYKFGTCDSSITPVGPSTADDPRSKLGSVPYGLAINHCAKEKVVALTYDDGPSEYTDALLDLLNKYNFHATFFVTGSNNGKYPIDWDGRSWNSIVRMMQEGHQIGSHTWSHYNLNQMNSSFRLDQMYKNERSIANIIGKYPTYMRAPYSACSQESGCSADMEKLGYHRISHDFNTQDWRHPKADQIQASKDIAKELLGKLPASGNALSIQHDIEYSSASNLSAYLFEQIMNKGWRGVTVGECLFDPEQNWYRYPSTTQMTVDGCVISVGKFCGSLKPFGSLEECKTSSKDCVDQSKECYKEAGSESGILCASYQVKCNAVIDHCMTCEGNSSATCDSKDVKYPIGAPSVRLV